MKKIQALAIILSILFITGCTSTSIKYNTPKVTDVKIQNVNGQQLFFSSRPLLVGEPYMDTWQRARLSAEIGYEFDQTFAKTAENLDTFSSVNKTFSKKDETLPVVNFDVKVRRNNNPLNSLLTLFSLGVIPYHQSTDFTVTCQYNSAGQARMYTFEDSLSIWTGWFVGGTTDPYESKYKERLLFENISRNALVKYDQDSSDKK